MKRIAFIAAIALGASTGTLEAVPVTMHLENGRTLAVDFDHASEEGVFWRLRPGDTDTQRTPLSQVVQVDFPLPAAWEEAEKVLATGDLDAALKEFAALADNRFELGYPVPGNYASKALLVLLDIRRRMLDADAIADQVRIVKREAETLPVDARGLPPAAEAWVAIGKEEWEAALAILESIKNGNSEIAYLRGRVLEGAGEPKQAIEAYAETYALGIGDRSEMSGDALRRSAQLLDGLENDERFPELHAQLKIYAELYGAGKLWKDAPEYFVKTAAAKLDAIQGMIDKPTASATSGPPPRLYDLSDLPPADERDWLLFQELDQPAFLVGRPPLENRGAEKTRAGWHFKGDGGKLVAGDRIDGDKKELRIRLVFTPTAPDGVLIDAPGGNGGFALYLADRELKFRWSRKNGENPKDYSLGKVNLNQQNSLHLTINSERIIRPRLQNEPVFADNVLVPGLLDLGKPLSLSVGNRFREAFPPAENLPPFTGSIHFLSVGLEKSLKDVAEKELAMFGGNRVVANPPSPPDPDDPPAPAAQAAATSDPGAPAPYEPPQPVYELAALPRFQDRDWILPQELNPRIYFINQPPFINEGAARTATGWAFDGESSMLKFNPAPLKNTRLRIRSLFTPARPDGVLLHAGRKNDGVFGLYLLDGDLLFLWNRNPQGGQKPATFNLGKVLLNQPNSLGLQVVDKNQVKAWLNGVPLPEGEKVAGYIQPGYPIDIRVSGKSGALLVEKNLPKFKGTIHFLSIGADTAFGRINEAEREMWDDKNVRFAPPPSP